MKEASPDFQLVYQSTCASMGDYRFPCDARGEVDLNRLDDRSRNNYLFARAMAGRAMEFPQVVQASPAPRINEGILQ
jgi:hypothetical protein